MTALAIQSIAGFSRYLRASMLDVMRQDYVRTAKAKGADPASASSDATRCATPSSRSSR